MRMLKTVGIDDAKIRAARKRILAAALAVMVMVTFTPAAGPFAFAADDGGAADNTAAVDANAADAAGADTYSEADGGHAGKDLYGKLRRTSRHRIGIMPSAGAAGEEDSEEAADEELTLADYKYILKQYVENALQEVSGEGESAYSKDVWKEIMALYDETIAFINSAEDEAEIVDTDGFFLYPNEKIEANIAVIEALCEMNLHYVKDQKSGVAYMKRDIKTSLEVCRASFAEQRYNDFYKARLTDLFADIQADLAKAKTLRDCVSVTARVEEELLSNLPMMEEFLMLLVFDEEEDPGFKYLYTEDEVESQREAVANRVNCYVDVQLKESGYKGNIKAMKAEAKKLIASLKGLEIVEDIWRTGENWIAAKEKQTGIAYEPLGEGDRIRALRELNQLSYKYTMSDYSDISWEEVEMIFMDAAAIIQNAEKKAEIRNLISDTKKKLAKVPTLVKETAQVKKAAISELKKLTNKKKYTATGVKIAKAAIKKIKKSGDLDEIHQIWNDTEAKCKKYIRKFRITTSKKGPGKVSKSKSVKYGGKYTVKLQPKAGKRIKRVYIDGKRKKLKNSYTFRNVRKKHKVRVVFGN